MEWIKLDEGGEVQFVTEECKLVPEIQELQSLKYNKGKGDIDGRKRFRSKQELKYLYLTYSPKSPYKDYSERERIEEAKKDCRFSEFWVESPELKLLIPKFIKGSQNKISRLLVTAESVLDKLDSHLNTLDLSERNEGGMFVHKPKEVIDTLKQLPSLAATLQELEQQVRNGSVGTPKSKGDHELGWRAIKGQETRTRSQEDTED